MRAVCVVVLDEDAEDMRVAAGEVSRKTNTLEDISDSLSACHPVVRGVDVEALAHDLPDLRVRIELRLDPERRSASLGAGGAVKSGVTIAPDVRAPSRGVGHVLNGSRPPTLGAASVFGWRFVSKIAIRGGTLISADRPPRRTDLLVESGTIQDVAPRVRPTAREIDASGCFVIAGLLDAHTHSGQILAPRIWENVGLEQWMLLAVYLADPLTPDEAYLAAAVTGGELMTTGAVGLLDHAPSLGWESSAESVEAVISAYVDLGLRATVAPLFSNRYLWEPWPEVLRPDPRSLASVPLPGPPSSDAILSQARGFLERWKDRHARIRCLLGPSAPERCTADLLRGAAALVREFGVGVHVHLLEARTQRLSSPGESPVGLLDRLGLLGPASSVAHGVWLRSDEIELLARTGTTVVHNPVSNLRLGSGIAPLGALRAAAVPVALGGDGGLLHESLDMFEVMKLTALLHKLDGPPARWPTAAAVLELCQAGGARAMGLSPGRLEPGHRADVVLLDAARLACASDEEALNGIVYGDAARAVRTVIVDGRVVVEDGQPILPGWEKLRAKVAQVRAVRVADCRRRHTDALPLLDDLGRVAASERSTGPLDWPASTD